MAENRRVLRAVERLRGALVALQVGRVPGGDHRGQGIGRGNDVHTERADQVERARVDAADVRDGVAGRVLHEHAARAAEQGLEVFEHLLAAAVRLDVEAESTEVARVDVVDQQARRARARDEQEGAARGVLGRAEESGEGGVGAAEVVDEPAIGARAVELVLDARRAAGQQQVSARRVVDGGHTRIECSQSSLDVVLTSEACVNGQIEV